MQDKLLFREIIQKIKEYADEHNNQVSVAEIKDFLKELELDEEKLVFVYEYLESQKIRIIGKNTATETVGKNQKTDTIEKAEDVEGTEDNVHDTVNNEEDISEDYIKKQDMAETEGNKNHSKAVFEPNQVYEAYLNDVQEAVGEVEEQKLLELFRNAVNGSGMDKSMLIEYYLKTVIEIAEKYQGSHLQLNDLIQEGNIGLMLALDTIEEMSSLSEYEAYIAEKVRQSIRQAEEDYIDSKDSEEQIVQRVNHLNQAIKNLEEDMERKVSIEELSMYLDMPVDEIKDILRMAGDDIEVENKPVNGQHGHVHGDHGHTL